MFSFGIIGENFEVFESRAVSWSISRVRCLPVVTAVSG